MKIWMTVLFFIASILFCLADEKKSGLLFGMSSIPEQNTAGVFITPYKDVQIQSGVIFGTENDWAGFAGLRINVGRRKRKISFLQKD